MVSGALFLDSSLKYTFLVCFLSSREILFSRAIVLFSTDSDSFILSRNIVLLALPRNIKIFEGRVEIYHSICTSIMGLEVSGILFSNLLNLELNYFIFSFGLALRFDKSLIKVAVVQSSPDFNKKCSSNIS